MFTSSIAVYGPGQLPMTEDLLPQPEDSYGIAKLRRRAGAARRRTSMFGLDYVIFRPHNVYGERQNIGDRYRNVIGIFMNQIMRGEPMTIFGDGTQTRAFTYVGDVAPVDRDGAVGPTAPAARSSTSAPTRRTASTSSPTSCGGRWASRDHPVRHLAARNEVLHAFSDHSKLHRVFGLSAQVDLREGVRRMADWAREHGARETSLFAGIEIERGLPEAWAQLRAG